MRYIDDFDDPFNQDLQRDFAKQYKEDKNVNALIDIVKHCSAHSIYMITRNLNYTRAVLEAGIKKLEEANKGKVTAKQSQANAEQIEQAKKEIEFINKLQTKITPVFLKKWIEKCFDRKLIFDYIKAVDCSDPKTQKLFDEAIVKMHSVGYLMHYMETVPFANKTFVENAILNGSDYCLKYEYGLHNPKKRKLVIQSMNKQAERQKEHAGIIKQYAGELKDMKNAPAAEEAKML